MCLVMWFHDTNRVEFSSKRFRPEGGDVDEMLHNQIIL